MLLKMAKCEANKNNQAGTMQFNEFAKLNRVHQHSVGASVGLIYFLISLPAYKNRVRMEVTKQGFARILGCILLADPELFQLV